jgi:transposase
MGSQGKSAMESERVLEVVPLTVYKWRQRCRRDGLEGPRDRARPGRPRRPSEAKVREVLELTTKRIPQAVTHRRVRLMMTHAQVTQWQEQQVWRPPIYVLIG